MEQGRDLVTAAILAEVERALSRDVERTGRPRPLPVYQDLFPGHADAIAEHLAPLLPDVGGETTCEWGPWVRTAPHETSPRIGPWFLEDVLEQHPRHGRFLARADGEEEARYEIEVTEDLPDARQRLLAVRARVAALARLDLPGLHPPIGAGLHENAIWIASLRLEGLPYLARAGDEEPDPVDHLRVLSRVARLLSDLHARGEVHGAVRFGNVTLDAEGRPALGGLGREPLLPELLALGPFGGYDHAPEVRAGAGPTASADVWGLGQFLFEILTDTPLLSCLALDAADAAALLAPARAELATTRSWARDLTRLGSAALDPDPARRPTAATFAERIERWLARLGTARKSGLLPDSRPSRLLRHGLALVCLALAAATVTGLLALRNESRARRAAERRAQRLEWEVEGLREEVRALEPAHRPPSSSTAR